MNEAIKKPGRHMDINGMAFEVIGDKAEINFVDLICDSREQNGMVHLDLGAAFTEFGNSPCVQVQTRLRMSLLTAQNIHKALGVMINAAMKPVAAVDKKRAN